jgi:DNA-binding GntR family transcriptional regulator
MVNNPETVNAVVTALRADIERGIYGSEGIIPPRTQLARKFGVSSETVNRAILHLQAMGLVVPYGRNVVANPTRLRIPGLTPSFDGFLQKQGLEPYFENVGIPEVVTLDEETARAFKLEPGTKAVRRLRLQGEKRGGASLGRKKAGESLIIWYRLAETFYLYDLLQEIVGDEWIERVKIDARFNVTAAIEEKTGQSIKIGHSELIPRFPTEQEQQLLNITFQTPVIEHYRLCYNQDSNLLLMFNRIVLVGHKFNFEFDYPISL